MYHNHTQYCAHGEIIQGGQINKPGLRFLPELSLSGPSKLVILWLLLLFLHDCASSLLKHCSVSNCSDTTADGCCKLGCDFFLSQMLLFTN